MHGLIVSSRETLFSCHRPVILGRHSGVLPSESAKLSGNCWILIQMVVWTHLVASLFFQKIASVLAPELSRLFHRLLRCGEFPLERPSHQYSFRKNLGTCDALLDIVCASQMELDRGGELALDQIDFSAAFNRVNHAD